MCAQRLERDSAAATSRPDEAGPSLSATSLGRAQGLVLQQPTSQSNKVPPSLSEDYGGPRTSDELTGTPHGSLVQSGINLKEWISTMEGRFAGTRDLLGSLSYGV